MRRGLKGEPLDPNTREQVARQIQQSLAPRAGEEPPQDTLFLVLSMHILRTDDPSLTLGSFRRILKGFDLGSLHKLRLLADAEQWAGIESNCRGSWQTLQDQFERGKTTEKTFRTDWISEKLNRAIEAACEGLSTAWIATAWCENGPRGKADGERLIYKLRWHKKARQPPTHPPSPIAILSPKDGDRVMTVGIIRGRAPAGMWPVLLVRPLIPEACCWWIQPAVTKSDPDSGFSAPVYFGDASPKITPPGTAFEIVIVGVFDRDEARMYVEGQTVASLPSSLPRSDSVIVTRA